MTVSVYTNTAIVLAFMAGVTSALAYARDEEWLAVVITIWAALLCGSLAVTGAA